MDSGMDCPLAQVFKQRRVHKEKEVTVLSQGADGEVIGNREGRMHLNQGVSEAALSDMGQLQLSQPPHTAPRCLDKGKTVLGDDSIVASPTLGPPTSFCKGSAQRGFQLGRARPRGSSVMTDKASGAKRTPVMGPGGRAHHEK
ncbi:unnamed protein product [Prunus armeniaca]|uniref:Uncharacterized protein n=1 Tax=Prunus armeniaca TaxID=36596 RepID=A0A6J5UR14_PRUAR|nr:unnamed protein product [Prunus armeniaca]